MSVTKTVAPIALFAMSGCLGPDLDYGAKPTTFRYTEAGISGLNAVRPYPTPDDVCEVISENQAIREPANDGSFLIACPKHERGAINDRRGEGAKVIAYARHWTILSVPAS